MGEVLQMEQRGSFFLEGLGPLCPWRREGSDPRQLAWLLLYSKDEEGKRGT
jgi:hypothetical protein